MKGMGIEMPLYGYLNRRTLPMRRSVVHPHTGYFYEGWATTKRHKICVDRARIVDLLLDAWARTLRTDDEIAFDGQGYSLL